MLALIRSMITGVDDNSNTYFMDANANIYLRPANSESNKNIGRLRYKNRLLSYIKDEDESQRFRKTDAWSINYRVLQIVDLVYFITDEESYKITKEKALKHGEFFHFKSSTEKKLYVPVKFWTKKSEIK